MRNLRNQFRRFVSPTGEDEGVVPATPSLSLTQIVRRFWPDARPYRRWIPALLVLIALAAAIETAEIWLFKLLVDDVLVPGEVSPLLWIALAYLTLTLVGGLVNFGDEYLSDWLSEHFLLNLRSRVFGHVQGLSLDVLDRRRLGDVIARVTDDVRTIETFVLSGLTDGLGSILRIVFFSAALFYLQWQLALVALVVVPLFYFAARTFGRLIKRTAREARRRSGSLTALAEQSLTNVALVQASNRQEHELRRFRSEGEGIVRARLASTRIHALFSPVVDLIELAGVLLVIVLGTLAVANGSLTIGGILVFITYLTQLYSPVRSLSSLSNRFFEAAAGAERVIELLDERPRVTERPDAVRLGRARGVLELAEVDFTYPGSSRPAVHGLSLRAEPGETVALVGASGAGKSTVARLLLRFYDPDAGAARLDGHDLRELELASLRRNVALLAQEGLIMRGTVRENIGYGRPGATEPEIVAAARSAGAEDFILDLPEGYDTDLRERGRRLSGGQRQRIAIARALACDAPALILDEPTTGLDADARMALAEPLRRLMSERTTIVISHDLLTVRDADRILVLSGGRVIESGDHEQLLARGDAYAAIWSLHHGNATGVHASHENPGHLVGALP